MIHQDSFPAKEYQGAQIGSIPEQKGLYAWYYRPRSLALQNEAIRHTIAKLLNPKSAVKTTVLQRYGLQVESSATGNTLIGSEKLSVPEVLDEVFKEAGPFLSWFFQSPEFAHFCRPIYIGIAKNLRDRVYSQHYVGLIEYWDPEHRVSKFTSNTGNASVQEVMDALDIPHSFSLEARVHGILPSDLMVSVLATHNMPDAIGIDGPSASESSTRRALERLLQLLSDPICGRR